MRHYVELGVTFTCVIYHSRTNTSTPNALFSFLKNVTEDDEVLGPDTLNSMKALLYSNETNTLFIVS